MKKYKGVAATTDKTKENWNGTSEFTDEALTELANTAQGCPVSLNFDETKEIGKILCAQNNNGKIEIKFELNDEFELTDEHRIVPCYLCIADHWEETGDDVHRKINSAKSISYGITLTPIEKNLPPIEKEDK